MMSMSNSTAVAPPEGTTSDTNPTHQSPNGKTKGGLDGKPPTKNDVGPPSKILTLEAALNKIEAIVHQTPLDCPEQQNLLMLMQANLLIVRQPHAQREELFERLAQLRQERKDKIQRNMENRVIAVALAKEFKQHSAVQKRPNAANHH